MKMFKFLITILFLIIETQSQSIGVSTDLGMIRGSIQQTRHNVNYFSFRGIRYGLPPIGNLRWKAPEPFGPWDGIYDATEDGPMCFQRPSGISPLENMSEDCLRLNIYTKNLSGTNETLRPVLFYIHGGAFKIGSGRSTNSNPTYLMDRDVVVVAINYRLGALGFYGLGIEGCPGNAGFKDQLLALRWVQNHIHNFGGNPSQVTIMGHSAGSMSVSLQMVSPLSRGLFRSAILMSGSMTSHLTTRHDLKPQVERLANHVNCSIETSESMLECLLQQPPLAFTDESIYVDWAFTPSTVWGPVIEKDFGQERFLTQTPEQAIMRNEFNNVPILTGITRDEFAIQGSRVLQNDEWTYEMENDFERVAPIAFFYERDTERSRNISQQLKAEFIKSPLELNSSIPDLQKLFGDATIALGNHRLVQLLWDKTNVFYYKSDYVGRFSLFNHPGDEPYGVDHGDDLQYITRSPFFPQIGFDDPEYETVERYTRLWTNFVINGNPNDPEDNYINAVTWLPYNNNDKNYLNIGNELEIKSGLFYERFEFWQKLFPFGDE